MMMKKNLIILLLLTTTACAPPAKEDGPSVQHGFSSALTGLGHLLLSPLQIAAGLLEGIASVPYYLSTNLNTINDGLIKAQAQITLDDTYESAYGKRLSEVPASGDTGVVFRRMKHATEFFQTILKRYGVYDSQHYILTSVESGPYVLLAVVYRPTDPITVIDKYDGKTVHSFTAVDRLFYEPFKQQVNGQALDNVIDWAALSKEAIATQRAQAILLTLAANSALRGKKSEMYWAIEQRWLAGEAAQIVQQRADDIEARMKL